MNSASISSQTPTGSGALAVFAEAVRRVPEDHRSRMLAGKCLQKLGEPERAVSVFHAAAEGLLRRDYLLSAIASCKLALLLSPGERRVKETLARIHSRAARSLGRAAVPPPLPPEALYDGKVSEDLMSLSGSELSDKAITVLAAPDTGGGADQGARPPLPLFAELSKEAFIELVGLMDYRSLEPGQIISEEGKGGDRIYVIIAGKAEITRTSEGKQRTLAFLGGGSIFGELSVLTGAAPTATVTTVAETETFEIEREDLNVLARAHPTVPQVLATFAQARMAKNLTATSPSSSRSRGRSRRAAQPLPLPRPQAGREGAHRGRVGAGPLPGAGRRAGGAEGGSGRWADVAGDPARGRHRGEISLLTGLRASATVLATRKTAVAVLDRKAFEELLKQFPQVRSYLQGLSDRRLKLNRRGAAARRDPRRRRAGGGRQRVKGRTAAVLAALAAATVVLLAWPKAAVSPEDEIRALVAQCVAGVEAKDLSAFSAALAEDFKGQGGLSRAEVKGLVARAGARRGRGGVPCSTQPRRHRRGRHRGPPRGPLPLPAHQARTEDEAQGAVASAWRIEAELQKRDGRWFFTSARYQQL